MYESKQTRKAKEMRNFATTLLMAVLFIAVLNIAEFVFMLLPLLPVALASVLMLVLMLQVLHALGVIDYDLSKLRK